MTVNTLFELRASALLFFLFLPFTTLVAQNQTIEAVYAGSEYSQNSETGIMERIDYVYCKKCLEISIF